MGTIDSSDYNKLAECIPEIDAIPRSPRPPRIFRRDLSVPEVLQIEAMLEPAVSHELWDMAAKEFDWALSVNGHVPGRPGHVDYTSAVTAIRQLTYLHGLPALEANAVRWFFNSEFGRFDDTKESAHGLTLQEFQASWKNLLMA